MEKLSINELKELEKLSILCRGDILKMTTLAGSGHPGGSLSSIDMYLTVYKMANISPDNYKSLDRDRIIVSHGHTSPGVYSVLGRNGFFDIDEAIAYFRLAGSIFEGHIERMVPGVEWTTGNLGQGLSAACGMALAAKYFSKSYNVYCFMGDGEQQKGQISEARRFAIKYRLNNLIAFVDYNRLQISGNIADVMPQNIKDEYIADGWAVLEIDGHNFEEISRAIIEANKIERPVLILAHTIMGKGVSFMENKEVYHGKALSEEQLDEALKELGIENDLEKYKKMRANFSFDETKHEIFRYEINIDTGIPKTYGVKVKTDNRSAFGAAITDLVQLNSLKSDSNPILVFDCDLAGSVKTDKVAADFKEYFYESGIQEHHTATCAGAASVNGIVSFFADFGVFGIDETYNQQRLNDINDTNLKVVTTHVGIDVGEDGKTHQCIDYIGVMRNLYGFKVIVPADPNQTDRAVRYAASKYGNFLISMGRSKTAVIPDENGKPFFGEDYVFEYGKIDIIRDGEIPLLSYGSMLQRGLEVVEILKNEGLNLALLNVSCPFHLDKDTLLKFKDSKIWFTYEDHNVNSGLGAIIADFIATNGLGIKLVKFGIKNYSYSGKPDNIFSLIGLSPKAIAADIKSYL
ncbi:transketolase [Deferribacter autotrophicus]|uniref:Transketolase n=1 Tax=Deferribacter autotrophicus TaxID=500465 RepID=A0A5A8F6J9_9BACT|nr:transketolase [Deferribacter autotrophicus]KAA0258869.1 transketolase [Deferribacter autotrophicus]